MTNQILATINGHTVYDLRNGGYCVGIKPGDIVVFEREAYQVGQWKRSGRLDLSEPATTEQFFRVLDERLAMQADLDDTYAAFLDGTR